MMLLDKFSSACLTAGLFFVLAIQSAQVFAAADWSQLSPKQQELLEPLKNDWNSMSRSQKERWLQVGKKYESAPPERQATMRERIGTWSGMSPQEKAAARENFKALKEKRQGERNSSWNSYQSLDPQQRDEFKGRSTNNR